MWPVCLFMSAALHFTLLVSVDVKSSSQAEDSAKVFSLVDLPSPQPTAAPREMVAFRADRAADPAVGDAKTKLESDKRSAIPLPDKELSIERSPVFYTSSEVSHIAQLQLPLEGVLFSDDLSLSGRLVLELAISDKGKIVNIEVVEATDASGALRAHLLPLLRDAPYTPAYKAGKPVNSVRKVEFVLGVVTGDPTMGFNSSVSPGFRPKMDERGNILKVQPKQ